MPTNLPPLNPRPNRPEGGLPKLQPRPEATRELPRIEPRPAPRQTPSDALRPHLTTPETAARVAPSRGPRRHLVAAGALIALGSAAVGGVSARIFDDKSAPVEIQSSRPNLPSGGPGGTPEPALEDAVAVAKPSVVEVRSATEQSQGSGVIIEPQGLIVTNEHVVGSAQRVEIITSSGESIGADVVSADKAVDLAILRPSSSAGPGVRLVDDVVGPPPVGSKVFAIGSPFGLRNTVTAGVVSAFRTVNENGGQGVIQFDAPVNPGNSGGGLFDLAGELVGIPTSITSLNGGGNVGIGFAVPASRVRQQLARVR